MLIRLILTFSMFFTPLSHGASASRNCSESHLKDVRKKATSLYQRKRAKDAVLLLQEQIGSCPERKTETDFWLRSDLALFYHKADRDLDCEKLTAPLLTPTGRYKPSGDSKVDQAIAHNAALCGKKEEQNLAFVGKSEKCSLESSVELRSSVGIPRDTLPDGCESACLGLEAKPDSFSYEQSSDPDPNELCPALIFIAKEKGEPQAQARPLPLARKRRSSEPLRLLLPEPPERRDDGNATSGTHFRGRKGLLRRNRPGGNGRALSMVSRRSDPDPRPECWSPMRSGPRGPRTPVKIAK